MCCISHEVVCSFPIYLVRTFCGYWSVHPMCSICTCLCVLVWVCVVGCVWNALLGKPHTDMATSPQSQPFQSPLWLLTANPPTPYGLTYVTLHNNTLTAAFRHLGHSSGAIVLVIQSKWIGVNISLSGPSLVRVTQWPVRFGMCLFVCQIETEWSGYPQPNRAWESLRGRVRRECEIENLLLGN